MLALSGLQQFFFCIELLNINNIRGYKFEATQLGSVFRESTLFQLNDWHL